MLCFCNLSVPAARQSSGLKQRTRSSCRLAWVLPQRPKVESLSSAVAPVFMRQNHSLTCMQEIIVGPTIHAVQPLTFEDIRYHQLFPSCGSRSLESS